MVPVAGPEARREPLLWVQLMGLGILPLEGLLLLLLLAGADPGPLPLLERLFCWAIGGLAPALLLARRPADVWSLLLIQTPLRGRRELQRRLNGLQENLPLRIGMIAGAALELPLLAWLDRHAVVARTFSPLAGSPRLLALVLAATLLAVMLWQWQQILQALWLLGRPVALLEATTPLTVEQIEDRRLSLGLPLLLPEPLRWPPAGKIQADSAPAQAPDAPAPGDASGRAVTPVEEEEHTEEEEGTDLDEQVG